MLKKCPRCGAQYTKEALDMFETTVKAGFSINLTCGSCGAAMVVDESQVGGSTAGPDSKESKCFVATAACGDMNAWEVVTLSRFRDSVLLQGSIGRAFVELYYKTAPGPARLIAGSGILRTCARILFVQPVARLADAVMKYQNR